MFLTRTAALERMSGPLCDAVLGLQDSAATLAGLAQSNLLVVPLDRRGQWYRYHHLFRDLLLAELDLAGSPAWSRSWPAGGRPSGMKATGAPMRHWSTGCRPAMLIWWPGWLRC